MEVFRALWTRSVAQTSELKAIPAQNHTAIGIFFGQQRKDELIKEVQSISNWHMFSNSSSVDQCFGTSLFGLFGFPIQPGIQLEPPSSPNVAPSPVDLGGTTAPCA